MTENEGTIKYLGFMVTPAFNEGASPFLSQITLTGSLLVTDYIIDWMDGSEPEAGKFQKDGEYMRAVVEHEYTYKKGTSKYSGKAFYPLLVIGGKDEMGDRITNVFNTESKGRCLSILVNSKPVQD